MDYTRKNCFKNILWYVWYVDAWCIDLQIKKQQYLFDVSYTWEVFTIILLSNHRINTLISQKNYYVEHVLNMAHPILNVLTIAKTYRFCEFLFVNNPMYVSIQPISAVQFFVVRCSTPSIFILVMVNYHTCFDQISLLVIVITFFLQLKK